MGEMMKLPTLAELEYDRKGILWEGIVKWIKQNNTSGKRSLKVDRDELLPEFRKELLDSGYTLQQDGEFIKILW